MGISCFQYVHRLQKLKSLLSAFKLIKLPFEQNTSKAHFTNIPLAYRWLFVMVEPRSFEFIGIKDSLLDSIIIRITETRSIILVIFYKITRTFHKRNFSIFWQTTQFNRNSGLSQVQVVYLTHSGDSWRPKLRVPPIAW